MTKEADLHMTRGSDLPMTRGSTTITGHGSLSLARFLRREPGGGLPLLPRVVRR